MATFDIENNVFIKALTLNSQSSVLALSTAGKFADKNISVQITAKDGSVATPSVTIEQAPTISLTTATGVITSSYTASQSITPVVTEGWISNGTAGTVSTTGSASLTLPIASSSVSGDTFTINPGWIGSTTAYQVQSTSITTYNASVSGNNFANGSLAWEAGYIGLGTITGASFANTPTAGTTYLDISNTTGAPILISEDYLYINEGYTDNLKISLAKLVPNGASALLSDEHILSGYSAYNNDGILVAGSIPSKDVSDITITNNNINVPTGYYSEGANLVIDEGDYNAGISLSDITVTPGVTISNASTYGFTTTVPSGTHITIDPYSTSPTYAATATATITDAGYISLGNKNVSSTKTVSVAAGTNYYAPVIVPSFSGGSMSVTSNTNAVSTTPVVTIQSSGTFKTKGTELYGVTTIAPVSGVDGTTYLTIDGSGAVTEIGEVQSSATVSRNEVKYTNKAGVITTHTNVSALGASSTVVNAIANVTPDVVDDFSPLYIPIVTPSFSGGGLSVGTHTNAVTVTPKVTLQATGTLVDATDYGVTTTQPASGTYKTIDVKSTVTNGSVQSNFKVDRAASKFSSPAGAITQYDNVQSLASGSITSTQGVTVTPEVTDNFDTLYVPIVSPRANVRYIATTEVLAVTATPTVIISTTGTFFTNASLYGITTTKPSGVDGTNYLSLDNDNTITNGVVYERINTSITHTWAETAKGLVDLTQGNLANYNGSGYSKTGNVTITPEVTDNFATHYVPVIQPTFSGGGIVNSATNAIITNMATTTTSSYYIDAVATITSTRAQVNYSNPAGLMSARSSATAIQAVSANESSTATRIYIPKATFSTTEVGMMPSQSSSWDVTANNNNFIYNNSDIYNNNLQITATRTPSSSDYDFLVYAASGGYIEKNTYIEGKGIHGIGSSSTSRYLQGVTLNKPASGEAKFSITVPNGEGNDMITFVFHVDPNGNVVVDDSTANAFTS